MPLAAFKRPPGLPFGCAVSPGPIRSSSPRPNILVAQLRADWRGSQNQPPPLLFFHIAIVIAIDITAASVSSSRIVMATSMNLLSDGEKKLESQKSFKRKSFCAAQSFIHRRLRDLDPMPLPVSCFKFFHVDSHLAPPSLAGLFLSDPGGDS
jgi:hypothetical protein